MALALFAFAALPVAAAFVAYFSWSPSGGINYGELIEPRPLPDAVLTAPGGEHFALSGFKGRWLLVQIGPSQCGADCLKRLFVMRQVRLMQGKEMGRLERLWLLTDDGAPDAGLLRAYEGMQVGRGAAALLQLFPAEDDPREHLYLIDPLGNLMLRFPRDADPKGASKDLARLLKVSHVG